MAKRHRRRCYKHLPDLLVFVIIMNVVVVCISVTFLSSVIAVSNLQYKPIIGKSVILLQRYAIYYLGIVSENYHEIPGGHTYIAASYVKYIESAGARVVPILYPLTKYM